ncbi:hypothetical protein [Deinococcus sp. KSM4-11]|uniref:hypothetical protein n=1 Tax=Deinococcus sp. KSM4-11 TaxID=2568654 RepID=UPI00197AFE45|nr:hypothetical protein [Deinococcus sp. KSM4-11]
MVQVALASLQHSLAGLLSLARSAVPLLLVGVLALLLLGLFDRSRSRAALRWLSRRSRITGQWALVLLAIGAGSVLVQITRHAMDARLSAQQSARYANAADPAGGQTVQSAPRASVIGTHTYTRTLLLPQDIYRRLQKQGNWEALLPYLGQPDGTNVGALREGFRQRGTRLEYTRVMTLQTEQPVNLDSSKVVTDLKFTEPAGGRGLYYNATFTGDYTFTNPNAAPATMRFAFPLPSGSGTLSNFRLTVNGQVLHATDLTDGSVWQGQVPAGGVVRVSATYRNQGARSWHYELAQRREAIRAFSLSVNTDRPAKFQRYTLFPTRQSRTALGSATHLEWILQDVITAQDIALVFAQGSLRETLGKIGLLQWPALLLATALCLGWARTRRLTITPVPLATAALGLALGFTLGGVLTAYLPVTAAQGLGALAGLGLALSTLGRPFLAPLALGSVVPLVFLSGGHAGLLLTGLAALTLMLFRPGQVAHARPTSPLGRLQKSTG